VGFDDLYETLELAQLAIDEMDWEDCESTLKEVQEDGMVRINEHEI